MYKMDLYRNILYVIFYVSNTYYNVNALTYHILQPDHVQTKPRFLLFGMLDRSHDNHVTIYRGETHVLN